MLPSESNDETIVPPTQQPADLDTARTLWVPNAGGPPVVPQLPGYEILGELGRGGMGVVYKARQIGLKRVVALKMILAGAHAGDDARRRFLAEAEAVAKLHHPNIVQVYEIGEHGGLPYFSLEFCPGGSLADRLGGTPLPPAEAAALVETLAQTMQVAHERGVVHRDLKPANVLLSSPVPVPVPVPDSLPKKSGTGTGTGTGTGKTGGMGLPKITDFGLAKSLHADAAGHTASGAILGTPSYMSPEQAAGKPVGAATDIYALGAILYECLTGRPPFRAATVFDTVAQVINDEPVAPSRLQPRTSRDLETIALKCLQKDINRRYASASELADDLGRFRRGESIRARPVSPLAHALRWCRRNPVMTGLTVLIALSLLASWVNLRASLASVEALAQRNKQLLAQSVAVRLDERVRSNAQAAAMLSRSAGVRALLADADGRNSVHRPAVRQTLANVLRSNDDFASAFVLDAGGHALASTSPEHEANPKGYGGRDYFVEARKGRAYQSRIRIGSSTNEAGLYYSAPVPEGSGVVVIKMEAATVRRLVEELDVGASGHAFVVDEDGVVIAPDAAGLLWHSVEPISAADPSGAAVLERLRKESLPCLGVPELAALRGARQPGQLTYVRRGDGARRLVAYAPLREKKWVLAIDLDANQFSGTRDQLRWRYVAIGGLVVGLVALLLTSFIGRAIAAARAGRAVNDRV